MAVSTIKALTKGKVLVASEEVNCATSGYIASNSSGTASGTFTMLGNTEEYAHLVIPLFATYSVFSGSPSVTSANGGTVSIQLTNNSGASHTLSCKVRVLKFQQLQ